MIRMALQAALGAALVYGIIWSGAIACVIAGVSIQACGV